MWQVSREGEEGGEENACEWTGEEDAGVSREGPCLSDPASHGVCVGGPQRHVEHDHGIHDNEDGHRQEEGEVPAGVG